MQSFVAFIVVFLGAGFGGALRHAFNLLSVRWFGPDLPVGTLAVNVLGSLAIGLVAGYFTLRGQGASATRLFLATGVLGGFTTFSAFSLEAALWLQRGQVASAAAYAVGSLVLCVLAAFAGLVMAGS